MCLQSRFRLKYVPAILKRGKYLNDRRGTISGETLITESRCENRHQYPFFLVSHWFEFGLSLLNGKGERMIEQKKGKRDWGLILIGMWLLANGLPLWVGQAPRLAGLKPMK